MDMKGRGFQVFGRKDQDDELEKKIASLFEGEPLFERLDSEPKWRKRLHESAKKGRDAALSGVRSTSMSAKLLVVGGTALFSGSMYWQVQHFRVSPGKVSEVAGVSTTKKQATDSEGTTTANPSFKVITPNGTKESQGKERETPSKDKIYTYPDNIKGVPVKITEQPLPDTFAKDRDTKLAEFAKDNYLASIIQIDDSKFYHGLNQKSGVQTITGIRSGLLIFIQADKKLEDDDVMQYIISLR